MSEKFWVEGSQLPRRLLNWSNRRWEKDGPEHPKNPATGTKDLFYNKFEAKNKIFEYIEMYYNRKRTHSSLGYKSPFDYEKRSFQSLLTVH